MAVDGTPAPAPTEKALVESPSRRRTIGWYSALASVDPVDRTIGAGNAVTAHRVNDTAAIKPSNVVRELIATILKQQSSMLRVLVPSAVLPREWAQDSTRTRYSFQEVNQESSKPSSIPKGINNATRRRSRFL